MNKTIGILAHVDAGKTTFSEQLLYHTKTIKERGRVDHKDVCLDRHEIEKERLIAVFADQGKFTYRDSTYYIIDTPGHIDFSPEMERAIQVMDYAIVIVSAVEGVEGHTETVWQLLIKYNIPTFLRSEEHTSELQSRGHLVCRHLLEKKKKENKRTL